MALAHESHMRIPVEVTYRGLEPNPAIEEAIDKRVSTLEKYYDRITGCRVSVEAPHRSHRRGMRFRVRVDLTIPGAEIVAESHEEDGAHEDLHVAIRDAFRACRRQLQDEVSLQRGYVKAPAQA